MTVEATILLSCVPFSSVHVASQTAICIAAGVHPPCLSDHVRAMGERAIARTAVMVKVQTE